MKTFYILILCFCLHIKICTCQMTLIEEAAILASSAFQKQFITSVVWSQNDPSDIIEFLKIYQGSVVLTPLQYTDKTVIREFHKTIGYKQTVYIAPAIEEVEEFIKILNLDLVVAIRLILILTKPTTDSELARLMQTAWNNDLADILIVNLIGTEVILKTFYPYNNGKCGDSTPVILDDTTHMFPQKFRNFHKCDVRATLIPMSPYSRLTFDNGKLTSVSGIDGTIFQILLSIVNATMNVVSAKDHGGIGTIINGTYTGAFGDLVKKEADIFSPAAIINIVRYPFIQIAHMYEIAEINWYGPKRREISEWLRVVQPLMSNVTPLLVSSFLVFAVTVIIVRRLARHKSYSRDGVIFQLFVIFLGQEVKFENKSWLNNSLFVLWMWFCMIVRIVYQGDLVDAMAKTIYESPLGTFDQAVTKVNGYGGAEAIREFINETPYFENYNVIAFKQVPKHLKAIGAGKRFLVATEKLIAMDASRQLQVLSDDPVNIAPVCVFMRPGWPAAKEIDNMLLRMNEIGIIQEIYNKYYWDWKKDMNKNDDRAAKPLTIETLSGCFYGLGVFYLICVVVLFVEIIYHKLTLKHYKRPNKNFG